MSDIRAALVALLAKEFGPFLPHGPHDPQRFYGGAADAILAEFDVTPRGTVKPSVEDVARKHSRVGMDGTCVCGAEGIGFIIGYGEHLVAETLALIEKGEGRA